MFLEENSRLHWRVSGSSEETVLTDIENDSLWSGLCAL